MKELKKEANLREVKSVRVPPTCFVFLHFFSPFITRGCCTILSAQLFSLSVKKKAFHAKYMSKKPYT